MLTAPKSQRILPPEGTHIARLVRILHLGTILEEYMGEEKLLNKIDFTFELLEETHVFKQGEDAKPFMVSKEYTLSMGEKANLRKLIEGILGKSLSQEEASSFDIETLLNKACLIVVKHKVSKAGNSRAEIASASPLMKGQTAKEPLNEPKLLTYTNWDEEYYDSLPDFIKEKMAGSKEFEALKNLADSPNVQYDNGEIGPGDIPF